MYRDINEAAARRAKQMNSFSDYELDCLDTIRTRETFRYDLAQVGDLVDQSVIEDAVNILPPAYMTGKCVQMGEPYSTAKSADGRWRYTFQTFSKVRDGVWRYCGKCFHGETEEPK